jgi:hypothetical protein
MLQARPTIYRGIRMRSRLEAAFAQELDNDGLVEDWTYEPYAFASPEGQYLPDFIVQWIWGIGCVEVKPENADFDAALERMHVVHASEPSALLFVVTRIGNTNPFIYVRNCWAPSSPCALCRIKTCEKCHSSDIRTLPVRVEHGGPRQDYECRDCGWMVTEPVDWGGLPPRYSAAPTT